MNRRGFLSAMLAACVAPAIVRASSLMQVSAPSIWTYTWRWEEGGGTSFMEMSWVEEAIGDAMRLPPDLVDGAYVGRWVVAQNGFHLVNKIIRHEKGVLTLENGFRLPAAGDSFVIV